MNKNLSEKRHYSNLNQFVSRTRPSKIQRQQTGYGNMFPNQYVIAQIMWKNRFSFATLIFMNPLQRLLVLSKVSFQRIKLKRNFCFFSSRQQKGLNWAASWGNSANVLMEENKPVWMTVTKRFAPLPNVYRSK